MGIDVGLLQPGISAVPQKSTTIGVKRIYRSEGFEMDRKDAPRDEDDAWESLGEIVARIVADLVRKAAA